MTIIGTPVPRHPVKVGQVYIHEYRGLVRVLQVLGFESVRGKDGARERKARALVIGGISNRHHMHFRIDDLAKRTQYRLLQEAPQDLARV